MALPENLEEITDPDELKKFLTDENKEAEKWKALSRKNEEQAKANAAAVKELEELKSSGKSEAEQLREKLEAAEQRARQLEVTDLRKRLASDNELPDGLAEFLQGEDEPSILESIEKLKASIPQSETDPYATETVPEPKPKSGLYALHDTGDSGDQGEAVLKAMLGQTQ